MAFNGYKWDAVYRVRAVVESAASPAETSVDRQPVQTHRRAPRCGIARYDQGVRVASSGEHFCKQQSGAQSCERPTLVIDSVEQLACPAARVLIFFVGLAETQQADRGVLIEFCGHSGGPVYRDEPLRS